MKIELENKGKEELVVYKRKTHGWLEYADFVLLEIICVNISYILAYCLRHGWSKLPYSVPEYLLLAGIISLLDMAMMVLFDPFSRVLKRGPYREFLASLRHVMLVFASLTFYLFSVQESATYSRISIYLTFLFDFILGYCVRMFYRGTRCARRTHQRSMLVITDGTDTEELLKAIGEDDDNGILINGICIVNGKNSGLVKKTEVDSTGEQQGNHNPAGENSEEVKLTGDNWSGKKSKNNNPIGENSTGKKQKEEKQIGDKSAENEGQNSSDISEQKPLNRNISGIKVVCDEGNVAEYICREWVDEVIVKVADAAGFEPILRNIEESGVTIHLCVEQHANVTVRKQMVEKIGTLPVVTSSINTASSGQMLIKRLADIIGGLIGCIFTLIIGIIIAPFILIKSPGPLFFVQERIGQNGKRFKMIKFRSMVMDAEAKKAELKADNTMSNDMMFKLDFDPRIIGNKVLPDGTKKTGIGEFIRKTSLDEFPQFFNVLKGDMSLVGTRPPTPDEWDRYELHHRARLSVRPGITGLWQVSGRSDITDFEEVVRLDTEYINNWSIGMDVQILMKTIGVVCKGKGAK